MTNPKYTDHSSVELVIPPMGDDLFVANVARVSFDKWKTDFTPGIGPGSDERLIKFLAERNHWTPFGHPHISVRVTTPIFVARQLVKHQIGLVMNEVSRRYVDSEPEFYLPSEWRKRAPNKKQGSLDESLSIDDSCAAWDEYHRLTTTSLETYNSLLAKGVCPEQARIVLPLHTMTSFIWTGSLAAMIRIANLRVKQDAQYETSEVGAKILGIVSNHFPISTRYLSKVDESRLEKFLLTGETDADFDGD